MNMQQTIRNMRSLDLVSLISIMLLFAVLGVTPAYGGIADDDDGEYETNQIVVKLNPAAGATIEEINATYGTTTIATLLGSQQIYLLEILSGEDPEDVAEEMEKDARLLYAEPNFITDAPEADPSRIYAWGGYDPAPFYEQYAIEALNLTCAHHVNRGANVVVAVVDTGVQLDHPELATSLTPARYDFVDDDPVPEDELSGPIGGHGTHVAGVIRLVAPEAQIMPLRALRADGRGNVFLVAEAILYAAQNGADVINLSLGARAESDLLEDIIEDVVEDGVIVVAAAGNLNHNREQYPAAENEVLAVTAIGPTGEKTDFANYGQWIDVAAPGEGIYSTLPTSGYGWWSGTSMATPFVAGQAALIRSAYPSLSPEQVSALIRETAHSLDAQNPQFAGLLGAGRPDIGASLSCQTQSTLMSPVFIPLLLRVAKVVSGRSLSSN